MIELLDDIVGVEIEFVSENAYLLKNKKLSVELFGFREIFLQPFLRFRN
jgi:hypothetical protein